jgi:hypothetical protein
MILIDFVAVNKTPVHHIAAIHLGSGVCWTNRLHMPTSTGSPLSEAEQAAFQNFSFTAAWLDTSKV